MMKTGRGLLLSIVMLLLVELLTSDRQATIGKSPKPTAKSAPSQQSQKRPYNIVSYREAVYGTVSFRGAAPKRREIDMTADSVCVAANPDAQTEDVIVTKGKLANVLIYVKSGSALDEFDFEVPAEPAVLEHKKCQYAPRVQGLQAG